MNYQHKIAAGLLLCCLLVLFNCKGGGEITASWDYAPPNSVQVGTVTGDSVALSWDAVSIYSQAPIYLLYYRLDSNHEYQLLTNLTATAITLSNLLTNQYYQFSVATCLTLTGPSSVNSSPAEADTTLLATPQFSPAAGNYSSATNVTVSCADSGTTIYYTTDGSDPTTASTLYSAPVEVSADVTLKALAVKAGRPDSATGTAVYTVSVPVDQVTPPQFSPGAGSYSSAQSVYITNTTAGSTFRYTTNGTPPTSTSGTIFSGPITVDVSCTLQAIAYKAGMDDSTVTSAVYTITGPVQVATPIFNGTPPGTYISPQSIALYCSTTGASIYYTTNGVDPTTNDYLYSVPIDISADTTFKVFAVKDGMSASAVTNGNYTFVAATTEDFDGWSDGSGYNSSWKTNTFATSGLDFWYLNCMRYLNGSFYAMQVDDTPGGQFGWQIPTAVNGLQLKVQATTSMDDIAFFVKVNGTIVTNVLFPATTAPTAVDITGLGATAPVTVEVFNDTNVSTRRVLRFSEVSWY